MNDLALPKAGRGLGLRMTAVLQTECSLLSCSGCEKQTWKLMIQVMQRVVLHFVSASKGLAGVKAAVRGHQGVRMCACECVVTQPAWCSAHRITVL